MRRLLIALLAPLLAHAQVLQENTSWLGSGFRIVHRSQVNGPGSVEGVGHFSFVYFGGQLLCQCGSGSFFISPSGASAIFTGAGGVTTLFRTKKRTTKALTSGFVSSIRSVEWNEPADKAVVVFEQLSPTKPAPKPLQVLLEDGS
jgi:hypothetical protein